MDGTLFHRAGICIAAIMLWQTPAFADCPDNALQSTADNFIAVSQPGADVPEILKTVDGLVETCPTDPFVLKLAAMTYANAPSPDTATSVDRFTTSLNLISRMWEHVDDGPSGKSVTDQNGQKQTINFLNLYEIEKQITFGLLQAEQMSGVQSSYTHPPAGSDLGTRCRGTYRTAASIASLWIQQQGEHPGAYSLMNDRIARCEADLADRRYTRMLGRRARALLASIQRDPRQEGALEKAAQAKADSERFIELFGDYDNAGWLKSNDLALEQATAIVRANQPLELSEAVFMSPQLEDPATQHALALMLDEALAEDAQSGLASAYRAYRAALKAAYELTNSLDDPAPARLMIYKAAEAQASGKVRAPGHESLEPPPAFLYKWIKPAELE
nr:hypothetical protein [uncultured Hyphomonas sp.]